jgi:hypothetical protein
VVSFSWGFKISLSDTPFSASFEKIPGFGFFPVIGLVTFVFFEEQAETAKKLIINRNFFIIIPPAFYILYIYQYLKIHQLKYKNMKIKKAAYAAFSI